MRPSDTDALVAALLAIVPADTVPAPRHTGAFDTAAHHLDTAQTLLGRGAFAAARAQCSLARTCLAST